jgi:hypothetical protein
MKTSITVIKTPILWMGFSPINFSSFVLSLGLIIFLIEKLIGSRFDFNDIYFVCSS